jgi:hypothetical protein
MSRSVLDEASARSRIAASPDTVPVGIEVGATIDTSGDLTATASAVDDAWRAVWFGKEQVKDKHLVPSQKEPS